MNYLCVTPSYWPAIQYGGPIYSVHNLNKALVRKGIDVNVYTTNVGLEEKVVINKEHIVDGVKVTYFGFNNLFEMLGNTGWQYSWNMTNSLRKTLGSFDLIHISAVWNYTTAVAAYYCRKYKKPYVISPRGTLYPYTTSRKAWKKKPYYHLISKKDIVSASAVHYTTEDELKMCHSFLGLKNKPVLIPNGIERSEFANLHDKEKLRICYPILQGKKVILFLGRINRIKGLDILVKAFAELIKEKRDTHLLIAGSDENGYRAKVMELIDNEGIMEHVTFTGMLQGQQKFDALSGSDLLVLPSYSENFGMSVVEAMACNLPVVISDKVGIHKEVEHNNAGIVVETNAESVFNGIKTLLDNEMLRNEIVRNGEHLIKTYYDINKVATRMIRTYKETIKHENN